MAIVKDTMTSSSGEEVTIYIEVDTVEQHNRYYGDLRGQGDQIVEAAKDVFSSGMNLYSGPKSQVQKSAYGKISPFSIEIIP